MELLNLLILFRLEKLVIILGECMDLFLAIYGALCAWSITMDLLHTVTAFWAQRRYNAQLANLQSQIAPGNLPTNLVPGAFPQQGINTVGDDRGIGQYL